jgi:tRNA threonylcarbamoyladenosine biosynthesis protein TsaB
MKFYMLVLALDTTTRRGSAALGRDGALVDCEVGDAALTHAQRLPGDLMRLLARQQLAPGDIDLFAVAAGPGSFTGLRIGIATMQGLALATGRRMAGVSALDALNAAALRNGVRPHYEFAMGSDPILIGVLMDAGRGEVFSALYRGGELLDGPLAEKPADALTRWATYKEPGSDPGCFVGEGAVMYAELIHRAMPGAAVLSEVPALAPAIAAMAEVQARRHEALPPDAIRPIYVRRPDVELARDARSARHQAPGTPKP